MLQDFRSLLDERAFVGFALQGGFSMAVFFSFLAAAPYVMITVSHKAVVKSGHGAHGDDIIPPFVYFDREGTAFTYPGLNWHDETAALFAADCVLAQDDVLGFVDVPGHERFVRNMLAGAGVGIALVGYLWANATFKKRA
jgi:hypothetical protein